MPQYVLSIDIGASSGRHMLGFVQDGHLTLEEIYRFPNGASMQNGHLCWDIDTLWQHVLAGMKKCAELGKIPVSMGIDTWAVDHVLVDEAGCRLTPAVAYRDERTKPVLDRIPFDTLYRRTGIAMQPFNTVYQLMATPKELLQKAHRLLMIPDYLHYLLTGKMCNEYTNASSTALLDPANRTWNTDVLRMADIPAHLFPAAPKAPGTELGHLLPSIAQQVGFDCRVILPATHDTGSAYLAVPARDENAVYLSSGTWSLLGTELPAPVLSDTARDAGFTNEGGYGGTIRLLRNIMGLWMLQCLRKEYNERYTFAEMADMAAQGAAYTHIINATDNRFLAPVSMREEILSALRDQGAPLPQNENELLACVHRSLAVCYARAIRDLETLTGKRYTSINIVGGGCNNRTLNQWTADETNLPVLAGPSEGTALGNALAQLIALGNIADVPTARAMIRASFSVTEYTPNAKE